MCKTVFVFLCSQKPFCGSTPSTRPFIASVGSSLVKLLKRDISISERGGRTDSEAGRTLARLQKVAEVDAWSRFFPVFEEHVVKNFPDSVITNVPNFTSESEVPYYFARLFRYIFQPGIGLCMESVDEYREHKKMWTEGVEHIESKIQNNAVESLKLLEQKDKLMHELECFMNSPIYEKWVQVDDNRKRKKVAPEDDARGSSSSSCVEAEPPEPRESFKRVQIEPQECVLDAQVEQDAQEWSNAVSFL